MSPSPMLRLTFFLADVGSSIRLRPTEAAIPAGAETQNCQGYVTRRVQRRRQFIFVDVETSVFAFC